MKNAIGPCIWCNGTAKEAAEFYCSIFPNSQITAESHFMVQFTLNGNEFSTLNGGPKYTPNEGVSFIVQCDDQQEIDHFWNSLTADGGEESMCGWLKDKYGVSWQIIPSILGSLMSDPATAAKVGEAFMKMRKFDIAALLDAAK